MNKKRTVIGAIVAIVIVAALIIVPRMTGSTNHHQDTDQGTSTGDTATTASDLVPADYVPVGAQRVAAAADAVDTDGVITIGLLQLGDHPSLDDIRYGIIDGLAEKGYFNGVNVEIDYKSGNFDQNTMKTIADQFAADEKDMVIGIATQAAQALQNAFKGTDTPVIFAGITDPVSAKLVASLEAPGANVTGASMPTSDQPTVDLIKAVMPDATTVGVLYTSSEPNSSAQAKNIMPLLEAAGVTPVERTITTTTDLAQVAEQLASEVDAIYVPQDNAIAAAMPTLIDATNAHKVPVFPAVDAMVKDGGLATVGINQYLWGVDSGYIAADVLGGKDPATYPVVVSTTSNSFINSEEAELLGITFPDSVLSSAVDMTKSN